MPMTSYSLNCVCRRGKQWSELTDSNYDALIKLTIDYTFVCETLLSLAVSISYLGGTIISSQKGEVSVSPASTRRFTGTVLLVCGNTFPFGVTKILPSTYLQYWTYVENRLLSYGCIRQHDLTRNGCGINFQTSLNCCSTFSIFLTD